MPLTIGMSESQRLRWHNRAHFSADRDPTPADDGRPVLLAGQEVEPGFEPGMVWINTATGVVWACLNATAGAAIWAPRLHNPLAPPLVRSGAFLSPNFSFGATAWSWSAGYNADLFSALPVVVNARQSFSHIGFDVVTAPASTAEVTQAQIGIYRTAPNDPLTPILHRDCGKLTFGAGTGLRLIGATFTLDPGVYWLASKFNRNGGSGTLPAVTTLNASSEIGPFLCGLIGSTTTIGRANAVGLPLSVDAPADWSAYGMPPTFNAADTYTSINVPIVGLRAV